MESSSERPPSEREQEATQPQVREPAPETRASLEEFLAAEDLGTLERLYRERGAEAEGEALLKEVQADWHRQAMWAARASYAAGAPEAFEPERVRHGELEVAVYGVIHGILGGDDETYKAFVDEALARLPYTVFENGLNYFYPYEEQETIPDFAVSGTLGSLSLGLRVGIEFPLLVWEGVSELLKLGRSGGGQDLLDYDTRFYAIDPEVRRGVEPHPPLPSRPQIDYELSRWERHGVLAGWKDPAAIVLRSLYMAGYAVGSAERRGVKEVALVVGDLHTMEIVRFLADPERWATHPMFQAGRTFALRPALQRRLHFYRVKVVHLLAAALAGCLILVPATLLLWAYVLKPAYRYLHPWLAGGSG